MSFDTNIDVNQFQMMFSSLTLFLALKCVSANKENNPKFCRCGEARKGEKVMPIDIQDAIKDKTSTSTTKEPTESGDYDDSEVLTVKALDNNKIMVSSGSDKISHGILSCGASYENFGLIL